ncbi:MAG: phytanoyl-CoA dioxygenase family protein [Armatimonadetes bacterium]|nr:phytanoyl-CoA dioxygenase family protein [Armatimonadota bacterium]
MFEETGYQLIPEVLDLPIVERLRTALETAGDASQRGESVYARRNILALHDVQAVAADPRVLALTGVATIPTRAIFFDKVPGANWHVGWHQDRAIAVAERIELPGWGPWTVKAGVLHVLPPAAILEKMITVRLHLDDCDQTNGPLRVLPGSHRHGILSQEQIAALRKEAPEVTCTGSVGSAVVMSPLLLHASSPAESPQHRRVLHLEFAPESLLPEGLFFASLPQPLPSAETLVPRGEGKGEMQ